MGKQYHWFAETARINGSIIPFADVPEKDDARWTTAETRGSAYNAIKAKFAAIAVKTVDGKYITHPYAGSSFRCYPVNMGEVKVKNESAVKKEEKDMKKTSNEVLCRIIDKQSNEEKHLFAEIFHILHASGMYMEESQDFPGQVLVCKGENAVNLQVDSAIEFGRQLYKEVGDPEFVDSKNAAAIRVRLTELFKPAPAKQETTVPQPVETVENKPEKRKYGNMYVRLVLDNGSGGVLTNRRITYVEKDDEDAIFGTIYVEVATGRSDNPYEEMAEIQSVKIGTWYWNLKGDFDTPMIKIPNLSKANNFAYKKALIDELKELGFVYKGHKGYSSYGPDCHVLDSSRKTFSKPAPAPEPDNVIPEESEFFGPAI